MKLVPLNEVFDVEYGNQLDYVKMVKSDFDNTGVNFISRASKNFGIIGRVKEDILIAPYPAGLITVTLGGSYLLASFIQPEAFYTAQNIKVLRPKQPITFNEKLFYCLCIQQNRFRYSSHGREANVSLNNLLVPREMPVAFTKISLRGVLRNIKQAAAAGFQEFAPSHWESFKLSDLFDVTGTKTTPLKVLQGYGVGKYPYVTTQATDNGIAGFYNYKTEKGGVLTVDSAVTGYCSYQSSDFSASDHVEKLTPKFKLTQYVAMFIATVINYEQYRYNYGRKACQMRLKRMEIRLPATNGTPDFEYMEKYIKSLPYSKSL